MTASARIILPAFEQVRALEALRCLDFPFEEHRDGNWTVNSLEPRNSFTYGHLWLINDYQWEMVTGEQFDPKIGRYVPKGAVPCK